MRLLSFEYNGSSNYSDVLLYRENAFDIKKVICDKNRLFILIQRGNDYCLKCFTLLPNNELESNGEIKNLDAEKTGFVEDFICQNFLNGNIMITSENKFIKIYKGTS